MKPKEKAYELVTKFCITSYRPNVVKKAKQCALIAVDEIINSIVITDLTTAENQFIYWDEVKTEIEKL
jgi:hypothetical protein